MGFQDVAFLPSRANFSTTFLKKCGRGEYLGTTTCPNTVDEGLQGHAASKISSRPQNFFFVSVEFHGDHTADTEIR